MDAELRSELLAIRKGMGDVLAAFTAHERVDAERFERIHSDIRGLRSSAKELRDAEDTGRFRALDQKDSQLAEARAVLRDAEISRQQNQTQWLRAVVLVLISATVSALATWIGVR